MGELRKKGSRGGNSGRLAGPKMNVNLILIILAQGETCLLRTPWERRGVMESGSVNV